MVNFSYQDSVEYPHMSDLKKQSSSVTYSSILIYGFILTCRKRSLHLSSRAKILSLSLRLKAQLARCIPHKKNN